MSAVTKGLPSRSPPTQLPKEKHGRQLGSIRVAGKLADRILDFAMHARQRIDECVAEVREGVFDLVAHAELHGPQHAGLPQGGDEAAQLQLARSPLLGEDVRAVEGDELRGDLELRVERALALDLGGVGGEHRDDADVREELRRRIAPQLALSGVGKQPPQRRGEGSAPGAPRRAMAPDVVAILGDVGEERKVAERPHDRDRLVVGQRVEGLRERPPRRHVFQATGRHGEPTDGLDDVERELAFVLADRVPEEPPQQADVLGERRVLVVGAVQVSRSLPRGGYPR
jgi:hypothetical protein